MRETGKDGGEMINYEVHWQTSNGTRSLDTPDYEMARHFFQVCLDSNWPCKLVRVERTEEIDAAWEWRGE
jgi:hypothetical protein